MKVNKGCVLLATGLSGSGKTTVMNKVKEILEAKGFEDIKRLDGDIGRKSFSANLGFTAADRMKNHERAAAVASYLKLESKLVLCSYIAPSKSIRDAFSDICGVANIIFVDCPIEECASRDPKGMYSKLDDGKFMGNPFTGMHPDAPYESPEAADLTVKTNEELVEVSAQRIINFLVDKNVLPTDCFENI